MTFDIHGPVPAARLVNLVTTESGDEVLVYDQDSHHIHHLNEASAAVWQLCDGQRTVADIAVASGMTIETAQFALGKLSEAGLLQGEIAPASSQSRRSFMKKAAIAGGVAIPAVISVSAPTAAQGGSCPDCVEGPNCPDCNAANAGVHCCGEAANVLCRGQFTTPTNQGDWVSCTSNSNCSGYYNTCGATLNPPQTAICGRVVYLCAPPF